MSLWKKNQENQTFFLSVDWSVKKNYIVKRSQLICLTMQGDIMIIINTAKSIKCKVSNFKYTTYIINMQKMSYFMAKFTTMIAGMGKHNIQLYSRTIQNVTNIVAIWPWNHTHPENVSSLWTGSKIHSIINIYL